MGEFTDKKVLITGAAGVFGAWITQAFAKKGAALFLSDLRVDDLCRQVTELGPLDHEPVVHQDDATDQASLAQLVADVKKHWLSPDIFVDCAGIYPFSNILQTTNEQWDQIFNVNLRAPFILTRDIANLMLAEDIKGSIIHIGSGAARSLRLNGLPYCISKTGLERLAKGFALELAPSGIRVNVVEPGFSPGSKIADFPEGYVDRVLSGIPLGRTSGPDDTASAVLFLCSQKAGFITGTSLAVDGGNSIGRRPTKTRT